MDRKSAGVDGVRCKDGGGGGASRVNRRYASETDWAIATDKETKRWVVRNAKKSEREGLDRTMIMIMSL